MRWGWLNIVAFVLLGFVVQAKAQFDPLPPPPIIIEPQSGPMDGKALICTYPFEDSFYVLSPAHYLFKNGKFQLVDLDAFGKPKLVEGELAFFENTLHFYFPDGHKLGGDRVLKRSTLKMKYRDRASLRKVIGDCRLTTHAEIQDIFGRKYFPK